MLQVQIKRLLILFIALLAFSGITAFFVETVLQFLLKYFNFGAYLNSWMSSVYRVMVELNQEHPFISYGYDWLAFGHLVIALFFVGALKNPIANRWVISYGMLACVGIFPVAFIGGYFRNIPIIWQLVDCSFGVFGGLLLYVIQQKIKRLEMAT